ncbi:MAG: hypothetical protein Q9227_005964 [Pyrenula ochraceoflavens]
MAASRSQIPSGQYRESGGRWMERRESTSLKNALNEMDSQDDSKLYLAAQEEAADLVWKHRNPRAAEEEEVAPYANPDLKRVNGRVHKVIQGMHGRSQSLGYGDQFESFSRQQSQRSASDSSSNSNTAGDSVAKGSVRSKAYNHTFSAALSKFENSDGTLPMKRRNRVSFAPSESFYADKSPGLANGQRNISNGSTKGIFRNPEDEIYEEPQDLEASHETWIVDRPDPLRVKNRNALPQPSRPLPVKYDTAPALNLKPFDRFEIHRNSPTQSRNAGYMTNTPTPPASRQNQDDTELQIDQRLEKRSDDIRDATSMRLKDRSPKLPTPTAVSDRPGRPIVSFATDWKSNYSTDNLGEERDSNMPHPTRPIPSMSISEPAVPTIALPDSDLPAIPSISVSDSANPPIPMINLPEEETSTPTVGVHASDYSRVPNTGVLAAPYAQASRPLPSQPTKASPKPKSNRLPWLNRDAHITPAIRSNAPTATCANCALPISGRIVTASGSGSNSLKARFHPECFTCHHCATALECVAFYPEPEEKRQARLEEQAQELGLDNVEELGEAIEKELRFFCHLDFHEFFSPRCKSCKTPIEGEVVVAAGGEYHVGHFFCAECGDPFDSNTPFVEHNSYAYSGTRNALLVLSVVAISEMTADSL